jgi:hypothetical protein
MNLKRFFLATVLFINFGGFAQEQKEEDRECLRMRFLAGQELDLNNFKGATTYYLKGEKICNGYDKVNYERLTGTIRNVLYEEKDAEIKKAYSDTLLDVWDRMEKLGFLGDEISILRAQTEMGRTKPNMAKIDAYFVKGIAFEGVKLDEYYLSLYYYNLINMYVAADAKAKPELKKRVISEYFVMSKMVSDRGYSVKTQETLNTYLDGVVRTCDDILPELGGYMKNLPKEKDAKLVAVKNFMNLLDQKSCQGSKEFEMLLDTLISIDPGYEAMIQKARLLVSKKKYTEAMNVYRDAKALAPSATEAEDCDYEILKMQYNQNSYKAAYNTAMSISGRHKSEALKLAAGCVAALANSCGNSTIERKFNYYYAAELAARGGAPKYSNYFPTDAEIFEAGFSKGQSVSLSCWGVSVTIR